jgi:hypothetical protein
MQLIYSDQVFDMQTNAHVDVFAFYMNVTVRRRVRLVKYLKL